MLEALAQSSGAARCAIAIILKLIAYLLTNLLGSTSTCIPHLVGTQLLITSVHKRTLD
jgi:hypothetical protein